MISIDSVDKVTKRSSRGKGRLVRSLEFTPKPAANHKPRKPTTKSSASMWRDPLKNVLPSSTGFTTHKMSSVTNNFISSDLNNPLSSASSSSSEIDEMVEDLVDPGSGTLVFPQHDEVFRSSPLSNSSFIAEIEELEGFDNFADYAANNENFNGDNIETYQNTNESNFGMSWNPKQNKWVPLIYRYIFPSSAFDTSTTTINNSHNSGARITGSSSKWTLKNGQLTTTAPSTASTATFTFPPPQKSIMMGPARSDSDARDVCEKLLELIDDENLMLPVVKTSHPVSSSSPNKHQIIPPTGGNKTLLSEWSSLPSSPPPPIFHDVCNRPIPELRLSPPMSGKSIGKRLFQAATTQNSPCESPLTKRLRFSSSSSSTSSLA